MTQAASNEVVDNEVQTGQEQQEGQETQETGEESGAEGGAETEGSAAAADDEVAVTFGESPTPEEEDESRAPEWVRELRKQNREKDRKLREQEGEIARLKGAGQQPAAVVVGEEPTLEDCNYNAEDFKQKWKAWHQRKQDHDNQEATKADATKKQQEAWQSTLQAYAKEKSELKVKDFDEAEQTVRDTFSVPQQGIVLEAVDAGKRAALIYALGKNPAKLKELAAISNPIKFTAAVTKLEMQLKVTPKKTAPAPERRVQSSVAGAAAVDNTLEKLREEARRTGDLSKVVAYNRQKRTTG